MLLAVWLLTACEKGGSVDSWYYHEYDNESEHVFITVTGEVYYNSVRQNGVRLFLVNDDLEPVDDDINDSTSVYQLRGDVAGEYWLLAVYDYGSEPLMAAEMVYLEEDDEPLNYAVDLVVTAKNAAQEYVGDSDCVCEQSIGHLSYWSCESGVGWAWSECD